MQIERLVPDTIKKRTDEARRWLTISLKALSKSTPSVEDFVEQSNSLNKVQDQFQEVRDRIDLFGMFYNIFTEHNIGFKKEDRDSHTDAVTEISRLNLLINQVESSQNNNQDLFRKSLAEQIPVLNSRIDECLSHTEDEAFLKPTTSIFDILRRLDDLEATFKELESTASKYNNYQEVLQVPSTNFTNLENLREQLNLRCLMWRSLNEWEEKTDAWIKEKFSNINAKDI